MSRIGKQPIIIPSSVTYTFDEKSREVTFKSSKGQLSHIIHKNIILNLENNILQINITNPNDKYQKAIWGTTRAILNNLVFGLTDGFKKQLELNGVGYKMELGTDLTLYLGFSHPVVIKIPTSITLTLNKNILMGESSDKQKIGDFFTYIHDLKPCDVYKQKGFKFPDRFYRKKVGKKSK